MLGIFFTNELKLDFKDDQELVSKLIKVKLERGMSLHSLLSTGSYVRQSGYKYDAWLGRGYTLVSFACFHFFPGKNWCADAGITPMMFYQTRTEHGTEDVLAMMEIIWLRHIHKLPPTAGMSDIDLAKTIFFAGYNDNDLFNRKDEWQKFGLSVNYQRGGIKKLGKSLADKFGRDIGVVADADLSWSSSRFRRENPQLALDRCRYTDTIPADLHHLLERKKYPEFTYHSENVVPLNPQIHALITRKKWSDGIERRYDLAKEEWIKAPEGKKVVVFDQVMRDLSRRSKSGLKKLNATIKLHKMRRHITKSWVRLVWMHMEAR